MTSAQLAPALVVSFIAWRIYVRLRRNIGQQRLQPRRLMGRAIFFGAVSALLAVATGMFAPSWSLVALGGGLSLGVPLAAWGLHLTRFEVTAAGKFYRPNLWIGLALTLLLVWRLAYRLLIYLFAPSASVFKSPMPTQSPITLLMFGLTAGYYMAYSIGIVRRGKKLAV